MSTWPKWGQDVFVTIEVKVRHGDFTLGIRGTLAPPYTQVASIPQKWHSLEVPQWLAQHRSEQASHEMQHDSWS